LSREISAASGCGAGGRRLVWEELNLNCEGVWVPLSQRLKRGSLEPPLLAQLRDGL